MQEVWKPVVGFEGLYEVSNLGRVKSLERITKRSDGKTQFVRERILKLGIGTSGYYTVRISKGGVMKTFSVHKLMCESFLNHSPSRFKEVVDHIDGDRLNNNLNNLRLISHRENISLGFKNTSSKYPGVYFSSLAKKYKAHIRINGVRIQLGSFDNELEAHLAYKNKLKEVENGK